MDNLFYLEIITPEKQFYVGPAEGLVIPAIDGSYGVQPGHEPVVTAIEPGIARFRVNGVWQEVVVSDGLAEIMPDYAQYTRCPAYRCNAIIISAFLTVNIEITGF